MKNPPQNVLNGVEQRCALFKYPLTNTGKTLSAWRQRSEVVEGGTKDWSRLKKRVFGFIYLRLTLKREQQCTAEHLIPERTLLISKEAHDIP